jgi:hypothetical protein
MHGVDLTPAVQTGLAYYYFIVALANLAFAIWIDRKYKRTGATFLYLSASALFLMHAGIYFAHGGPTMPLWLRDLSDQGLSRGLVTLGVAPSHSAGLVWVVQALLWIIAILGVADAIACFVIGGKAKEQADGSGKTVFRGRLGTNERMVVWALAVSVLALLLYGTNAISYFLTAVSVFAALVIWRKPLTEPLVIFGILDLALLFGGWSMTDKDFRSIIVKPDNVPIVGLVFVVGFFTWLALRRAVINDERMSKGEPPMEKEDDEKVLVWPDLVYTELVCMVVVTVILVVWSVALPAPIEQPSSLTKTPNPSKAPWYFLGLQEMLVYYDPWIAGVVLPTVIIIGLMAIPYIDFNQKGNGYYTFVQRPFAIVNFLFGFVVLWVTLIFLGTFLRGPNWNFFGLYENWDPHKLVPLNNVNLSDYFWVRGLGKFWEPTGDTFMSWLFPILMRELPGILIVLGYFIILPPLLARTVFRNFFIRMGFFRYIVLVNLMLFMASLPIKMVLRWTMNLKYIVAIPEYFFNI